MSIQSAYDLLERSLIYHRGQSVGTAAACDDSVVAANYNECFVRDFVPSALAFLMSGRHEIVRNFLETVMHLSGHQQVMTGHKRSMGLMPASFHVVKDGDEEQVITDFGDRAIGRVTPVDSALWWMILLRAYVVATGDDAFAAREDVQRCISYILDLYLRERFESSPTLLVPDAAFMIDRRMAVYGYPLEIQTLYYGMLLAAHELLLDNERNAKLIRDLVALSDALDDHLQHYYWIDHQRFNQMHRFESEQFGRDVVNVLNVYPESIPGWMDGWLDAQSGFFVGNVGPGRIDFRFFAQGNLLAILFGIASDDQAQCIMNLYLKHWDKLVGEMPVKILYPAVVGEKWRFSTGSDPKNVPYSYHNGGNWPEQHRPIAAIVVGVRNILWITAGREAPFFTNHCRIQYLYRHFTDQLVPVLRIQVHDALGLVITGDAKQNSQQVALREKAEIDPPRSYVADKKAASRIEPSIHPTRYALWIHV